MKHLQMLKKKKFNRYNLTYLVHCLLARHKCKISMCWLRKKYPETNYTTKVKFDYPIYAETCIDILKDNLIERGWKKNTSLKNTLDYGKASLTIELESDKWGDIKYSITPFIKS